MKKYGIAAILAASMLLTACSDNEQPSWNNTVVGTSQTDVYSTSSSISDSQNLQVETSAPEPVEQLDIWDVLPEIPITDQSIFKTVSSYNDVKISGFNSSFSNARIPDTIEGKPVVEVVLKNPDPMKEYNLYNLPAKINLVELVMPDSVKDFTLPANASRTLRYINIPAGMTILRSGGFIGFTTLEKVYISNGVTQIGEKAFSGCSGLTEVYIPSSVKKIDSSAFENCTSLTSIKLPSRVQISKSTFSGCSNLEIEFQGKIYNSENIYDAVQYSNNILGFAGIY